MLELEDVFQEELFMGGCLPLSSKVHREERAKIHHAINELWLDYKTQIQNAPYSMTFCEYIMARRQAIEELSKWEEPLKPEILSVRVEED